MIRYVNRTLATLFRAMQPPERPLLVVLGATGTGKSQLAVDLAKRFNGEIINGDAMQMYHGLPIVTNKITSEEQQGIEHHLLGVVSLDEEPWRVGLFKKRAGQIIKEIRSRGKLPILVGGTHYYTQALLFEDSLVDVSQDDAYVHEDASPPPASQSFPILDGPTETILEELRLVDPVMAERWHPNDRRKIRRSLEIFLTSGRKASDIYAEQRNSKFEAREAEIDQNGSKQPETSDESALIFWVHSDPEILKTRLDVRVDKMLESGLLAEAKSMEQFLKQKIESGQTVDQTRGIWVAIGWKEFLPYLQALGSGAVSTAELRKLLEISVEQTKTATRQYAKSQVRWIRLKLLPALVSQNEMDKLFLLDGSNVENWSDDVLNPALETTKKFLEGCDLPPPQELSVAARQMLAQRTESEDRLPPFRRECAICNTTVVIEEQWNMHLKSRRHRALLKRSQKNMDWQRAVPHEDLSSTGTP